MRFGAFRRAGTSFGTRHEAGNSENAGCDRRGGVANSATSRRKTPRIPMAVVAVFSLVFMFSCAKRGYHVVTLASSDWDTTNNEVREGVKSLPLGKFESITIEPEKDWILRRLLGEIRPDLIVVVGTFALGPVRDVSDLPIVYVSPVFSGKSYRNTVCAPIVVSPDKQMEIISERLPDIRRVGFVFTDKWSSGLADKLKAAAEIRDIQAIAVKVATEAEAEAQMAALAETTDLFLMIQDYDVITDKTAATLFGISASKKYPVVSFCHRYFKMGAVLSINPPVFDAGVNASELGLEILMGKNAEDLPAVFVEFPVVLANPEIAKAFGVNLKWEGMGISNHAPAREPSQAIFREA